MTKPYGGKAYMFPMIKNFTLLIKSRINFERFNVHRRNIPEWATKKYLYKCYHDPSHQKDKFCPIFKLGTILDQAGVDNRTYLQGGIVEIDIAWDCNLDWDETHCKPEYSFYQLDEANANIEPGFNFKYANYYRENGLLKRDLIRAYGIRFIVNAHGKAGKFHINPTAMNFGSGLGLLGLVPMICDFIVFYLLKKRRVYAKARVDKVEKAPNTVGERQSKSQRLLNEKGKIELIAPKYLEEILNRVHFFPLVSDDHLWGRCAQDNFFCLRHARWERMVTRRLFCARHYFPIDS